MAVLLIYMKSSILIYAGVPKQVTGINQPLRNGIYQNPHLLYFMQKLSECNKEISAILMELS
ncbi:MAG: hypothetical protein NC177_04810 [Ruminococcus flavefaciens]|nr:hypothetical protein [Ruminococcus flavefaciens]